MRAGLPTRASLLLGSPTYVCAGRLRWERSSCGSRTPTRHCAVGMPTLSAPVVWQYWASHTEPKEPEPSCWLSSRSLKSTAQGNTSDARSRDKSATCKLDVSAHMPFPALPSGLCCHQQHSKGLLLYSAMSTAHLCSSRQAAVPDQCRGRLPLPQMRCPWTLIQTGSPWHCRAAPYPLTPCCRRACCPQAGPAPRHNPLQQQRHQRRPFLHPRPQRCAAAAGDAQGRTPGRPPGQLPPLSR